MTALPGSPARFRVPALEGDPGLAAMFAGLDVPAEWTARITDGIRSVGALALDTAKQQVPLLAGLSLDATLAERVEALRVWGEVAGDVALDEYDDQYQTNVLILSTVLAGLLPGLDEFSSSGPLDALRRAEEELTEAGLLVAQLAVHEVRGTHPDYLPGTVSIQDALAADQTHAVLSLRELAATWAGRWDGPRAMTATKRFPTADILTATGPLVSPRLIEAAYAVLGHMTGESLYTQVLPRASEVMTPELHRQLPWLADALAMLSDYSALPQDAIEAQVAKDIRRVEDIFGAAHPVRSAEHLWTRMDPLVELVDKIGAASEDGPSSAQDGGPRR